MTVTPWEDIIKNKNKKVLTVFPTQKVKASGPWRTTFNNAITEFNKLSTQLNLGVTLDAPSNATAPDPNTDAGAEVQFDLGNGQISYTAFGQPFVLTDRQGNPVNFSPTELHGATQQVKRSFGGPARIRRAFIFVPETPMVNALMKASPRPDDFKQVPRAAGSGIRLYIAVHEFIHACGLSNDEHNVQGPDADVFTIFPSPSPGPFDRPEQDKLLLHLAHPRPNVFAPPIFIKKKVADMIRNNWK
jgi:hypothetical protein